MPSSILLAPAPIGIIGLGAMGLPIAANLLKSGYKLKVHNRHREREKETTLEGAKSCDSPAETALGSEALLICVSDDNAVDNVLFGEDGAFKELKQGSIVINCSTINPYKSKEFAYNLSSKNIAYLDAPVTGGTEGAKSGTLTIMVGGSEESLRLSMPILNSIGKYVHHFGDIGRGQEVKAINQVLVAGNFVALAEAVALGQHLGLPMEKVLHALQEGAASSWALKNRATSMLKNNYPLGFKLSLHHKDLEIALNAAKDLGLNLPVSSTVKSMEKDLIDIGYSDEDVSALRRWIEPGKFVD